jgi:pentatricopeptide repeat protein
MGDEGIPPDTATFLAVIKACASIRCLETGERIHSEIDRRGLLTKREGVAVLGTALVHMYAKCGALPKAEEMFFSMLPERTAISWNALMAGYAQHELGHETLGLFEEMRKAGIAPNTATLVYVLQACGSTRCLEMGEAIHAELERPGSYAERNAVLDTALLDMYAKCGKMRKAQEVFDAIRVRTAVSWNALIAGYARLGLDDEALLRFREMCRGGGFTPDAVTLLPVLKACGNRGSLEMGRKIHGAAQEQGLLSDDAILSTAVIDMYVKCGALGEARAVFDEVPAARKSIEAWNALITGHAQLGRAEKVLRLCCMRGEGSSSIKPNAVTFLVAMMACSHAGLVQEGWMVFDAMEDGFGLAPSLEHYGCLIDLFGRAGCFDIAVAVVEAAPCPDRLPLWLGLLGACGKWADVELGKWAYGRLMELNPDSSSSASSAHVCMANAYASAFRLV